MHACMHNIPYNTIHILIFLRPQKTSRLDRKFSFIMATRRGLKINIYRRLMLTMRAQGGDRTSNRSHVTKAFFSKLIPMAAVAIPFSQLYNQALLWGYPYPSRCLSLSSTSSLFSGISCSPVRRGICILVLPTMQRYLTQTHLLFCCRPQRPI